MSKIKEFDQSMVQELSVIHSVKKEYDITSELEHAQLRYDYYLEYIPNSFTPFKNKAKEVIKKSENLIKAIDEFHDEVSGIDEISKFYLLYIGIDVNNIRDFDKVKPDINQASIKAQKFLDKHSSTKRGPKSNLSHICLINDLMRIYCEATGNDIGISKNPDSYEHGGPMLRFIRDFSSLLTADIISDNTIVHIINTIRKNDTIDDLLPF